MYENTRDRIVDGAGRDARDTGYDKDRGEAKDKGYDRKQGNHWNRRAYISVGWSNTGADSEIRE